MMGADPGMPKNILCFQRSASRGWWSFRCANMAPCCNLAAEEARSQLAFSDWGSLFCEVVQVGSGCGKVRLGTAVHSERLRG